MDKHKSGLKGNGVVMPGTDLDEAFRNDGIIGAGNPAYLIGSNFNKKVAPLDITKHHMCFAQEKLVKLINSLAQDNHVDWEDLQTLATINDALAKGINFLEHIEAVLKALGRLE